MAFPPPVPTPEQGSTIALVPAEPSPISPPLPWPRFWARQIDTLPFAYILGLLLGRFVPGSGAWSSWVLGILVYLVYIPVETVLLATWGTTIGKWLLNIAVRDSAGNKLSFGLAFQRSLRVWWQGLGAAVPLLSLALPIVAFNRLKEAGVTAWDAQYDLRVTHRPIGSWRIAVAVLFLATLPALMGWNAYRQSQVANVAEWRTVEESRFTARFPGQPTRKDTNIGANLIQVTYSLNRGRGAYLLNYNDRSAANVKVAPDQVLDLARDRMLTAINGTLLSERKIMVQGYPAREIELRRPDHRLLLAVRAILTPGRLYLLEVVRPETVQSQYPPAPFFAGFQLKSGTQTAA